MISFLINSSSNQNEQKKSSVPENWLELIQNELKVDVMGLFWILFARSRCRCRQIMLKAQKFSGNSWLIITGFQNYFEIIFMKKCPSLDNFVRPNWLKTGSSRAKISWPLARPIPKSLAVLVTWASIHSWPILSQIIYALHVWASEVIFTHKLISASFGQVQEPLVCSNNPVTV